jgi:hypothetical protein
MTMTKTHLVPFHGDKINIIENNGTAYVAVRPVCERLGLDWKSQWAKLRDPNNGWMCGDITTHDTSNRQQEMVCLALYDFPLWLASISPSKVKPEVRYTFLQYRDEAKRVLFNWFMGERNHWKHQADGLAAELFTRKPIYARVLLLAQSGYDFNHIWKATSYSQAKVADALRFVVQLGRFPALPAGTPAIVAPKAHAASEPDTMPLFG